MRTYFDLSSVKHYANIANAQKALNKAFDAEFFREFDYHFATQDGRIIPVIRCKPHQLCYAMMFAGRGFYVTN